MEGKHRGIKELGVFRRQTARAVARARLMMRSRNWIANIIRARRTECDGYLGLAFADEMLEDLHGIPRRALEQLIAADEERQPVRMR